MSHAGTQVEFSRDCEVVEIPAGHSMRIPRGTQAVVTQSLGGTFTVRLPNTGALVRVSREDADAIGLEPAAEEERGPSGEGDLEAQVWEALKTCYDPEIPVNIVDLGLVYDLRVQPVAGGGQMVGVKMTLTAQGCGMGTVIATDAQEKIQSLPGVSEARVDIVWDPPWNPQMITPEGRAKLGM
jgi:probable FeS assembly SUF system protein SufT